MPLIQVIVLAVVQGLTEFLPISSSAHLALTSWILGWPDQGLTFDIALHVGTLLAILVYFFRTWVEIIARGFGIRYGKDEAVQQNPMLLWLLAIGSIPVGILGFLFQDQAETTWRNPFVIGTMLIFVGLLMWWAERVSARRKDLGQISLTDSVAIGLAQGLSIVPGTSRSGITLSAALFRDLERPAAACFSFLLATPAIAGAALKALYDLHKHGGVPPDMRLPFILGVTLSGFTGCIVIAWLLRYLRRGTLYFFVYYRVVFGIIVIALAFFRHAAG